MGIDAGCGKGDNRGVAWLTKLPLAVYGGDRSARFWLDTFDRRSTPVEHRYV